jgi:hypothetical protein
MPPPPTDAPSDAPPRAGLSLRTKLVVGGVLAVLVVVFVVANWKSWEYQHWANAADQPEFEKKILTKGADPVLDARLLDNVKDDAKATRVRLACAKLLIEHNHLRDVEDLLLKGNPRAQRIALWALASRPWFHKQYLADPSFPVVPVLVSWVTDTSATGADRATALSNVVPQVWQYTPRGGKTTVPPEVLKSVKDLLVSPGGDEREGASVRMAAAGVVTGYRWCEGVPALVDAARSETDAQGRMWLMQRVVGVHDAEWEECKGAVTEDAALEVVDKALRHPGGGSINWGVRMAALSALARHPAWAAKRADEIRRIVESDASPEERSSALPALVASGDVAARGDVARWVHDRAPSVRSQAVQAVAGGKKELEPADHLSLLVGYFLEEPAPTPLALREVAQRLRGLAGSWIGFPEAGATGPGAATGDMTPVLLDLAAGKTVGGKTRADIGAAWWNWLASKHGVDAASLKAAFAARDAFWAKAKAGDLAGARAVLDGAPAKDSPLWEYERGRLAAGAKKP